MPRKASEFPITERNNPYREVPSGATQTMVLAIPARCTSDGRIVDVLKPSAESWSDFAPTVLGNMFRNLLFLFVRMLYKESLRASTMHDGVPQSIVFERVPTMTVSASGSRRANPTPDWRVHFHNFDTRTTFEMMVAEGLCDNLEYTNEKQSSKTAGSAPSMRKVMSLLKPWECYREITNPIRFFAACDSYTRNSNYLARANQLLPTARRTKNDVASKWGSGGDDEGGDEGRSGVVLGCGDVDTGVEQAAQTAYGRNGVVSAPPKSGGDSGGITSLLCSIFSIRNAISLTTTPMNVEQAISANYTDGCMMAAERAAEQHAATQAAERGRTEALQKRQQRQQQQQEGACDSSDEEDGGGGGGGGGGDGDEEVPASVAAVRMAQGASWFFPKPHCAYMAQVGTPESLYHQGMPGTGRKSAAAHVGIEKAMKVRALLDARDPNAAQQSAGQRHSHTQAHLNILLRELREARVTMSKTSDRYGGIESREERNAAIGALPGPLSAEDARDMDPDARVEYELMRAVDAIRITGLSPTEGGGCSTGAVGELEGPLVDALACPEINTRALEFCMADTADDGTMRGISTQNNVLDDIHMTDAFGEAHKDNTYVRRELWRLLNAGDVSYIDYALALALLSDKGLDDLKRLWTRDSNLSLGLRQAIGCFEEMMERRKSLSFIKRPVDYGEKEGAHKTFFTQWMAWLYLALGKHKRVVSAHQSIILMWFGAMDSLRQQVGMHTSFLQLGPAAASKSFTHEALRSMMPTGVGMLFDKKTTCADEGETSVVGEVDMEGEAKREVWGADPTGKSPLPVNTGDPKEKDRRTTGTVSMKVYEQDEDTGERRFRLIIRKNFKCCITASNDAISMFAPEMVQRTHPIVATLPVASDGTTTIADYMYMFSMFSSKSEDGADEFTDYMRSTWVMVALVENAIHMGGLDDVNMDIFHSDRSCIRRRLRELGIKRCLDRTLERMHNLARTLTIVHALEIVFHSELTGFMDHETGEMREFREGRPRFNIGMLRLLRPYLCCDRQISSWAMHLMGSEWVPAHHAQFVVALATVMRYPQNADRFTFRRRYDEDLGTHVDDHNYVRYRGSRDALAHAVHEHMPTLSVNDVKSMVTGLEERTFSGHEHATANVRDLDGEKVAIKGLLTADPPQTEEGAAVAVPLMPGAEPVHHVYVALAVFEESFGDAPAEKAGAAEAAAAAATAAAVAARTPAPAPDAPATAAAAAAMGDREPSPAVDATAMDVVVAAVPAGAVKYRHETVATMHPTDLVTSAILHVRNHKYARRDMIALPVSVRINAGYAHTLFGQYQVKRNPDYTQFYPNVEAQSKELASVLELNSNRLATKLERTINRTNAMTEAARTGVDAVALLSAYGHGGDDSSSDEDDAGDGAGDGYDAPTVQQVTAEAARRSRHALITDANIIEVDGDEEEFVWRMHLYRCGLGGPVDADEDENSVINLLEQGYTPEEIRAITHDWSSLPANVDSLQRSLYHIRTGKCGTGVVYPDTFAHHIGRKKTQTARSMMNTSSTLKRVRVQLFSTSKNPVIDVVRANKKRRLSMQVPTRTVSNGAESARKDTTKHTADLVVQDAPRRAHTAPFGLPHSSALTMFGRAVPPPINVRSRAPPAPSPSPSPAPPSPPPQPQRAAAMQFLDHGASTVAGIGEQGGFGPRSVSKNSMHGGIGSSPPMTNTGSTGSRNVRQCTPPMGDPDRSN